MIATNLASNPILVHQSSRDTTNNNCPVHITPEKLPSCPSHSLSNTPSLRDKLIPKGTHSCKVSCSTTLMQKLANDLGSNIMFHHPSSGDTPDHKSPGKPNRTSDKSTTTLTDNPPLPPLRKSMLAINLESISVSPSTLQAHQRHQRSKLSR